MTDGMDKLGEVSDESAAIVEAALEAKVEEAKQPALAIFDLENPHSVYNKAWPQFREKMIWAYQAAPVCFTYTEIELKQVFSFDDIAHRLRIRFWEEYWRALDKNTMMRSNEVVRSTCSTFHWKQTFLKIPHNVAWLLSVPLDFQTSMLNGVHKGLQAMHEVLEEPLKDPKTGRIDQKLAELKLKILVAFQNRTEGGIVQKMAIRQQVESRTHHTISGQAQASIQDVDKTLRAVDSELRQLEGKRETIDVDIRRELPFILDDLQSRKDVADGEEIREDIPDK